LQRASNGGFIIPEVTPVSIRGNGYADAPGIYSDGQIDGWRHVNNAVNAKRGRIMLQLWYVGRQTRTDLQPDGDAPVASFALKKQGRLRIRSEMDAAGDREKRVELLTAP
jgi:N-ethylmaleimide reductase